VIENSGVARESRDDKLYIETDELLRSNGGARLHQHVQPHAKPIDIELFVGAGCANVPDIDIQYARELRRRGERHEFSRILEPADPNDAVKNFRRQAGNDFRQIGCIQQASE
jgi:hypothetical protein